MPTVPETGALLEVRGERWQLTHTAPFGPCTILTLEGREASNARRRLRVLEPFERARPIRTDRLVRRSRRSVLRVALRAATETKPALGLWTAADAAIDLFPYQLEPALAVLGGATRLLLADAVGLGKTIQAGLVLAELRERGWVDRALVLCPAGLRATWARELRERFAIDAAVLDQAAIAATTASLPPGINPWSGHAVAIASIDLVKRPEVLAAVEAAPIDLLIADEAHHLTPGTDRGAAVERLAARAPWCVLVSATPHSGDEAAFAYLTAIGAHRDPIAIFRRSRADAGLPAARRTHVLAVTPTSAEAALHAAIDDYAQAIWRAKGREQQAARLIAITLARRAASSPLAIARTLERRLDLLAGIAVEPVQPGLPWEDEDAADGSAPDALLATPGLHDPDEERAVVAAALALARQCGPGAKVRRIARLLGGLREPAVVFTEYRDSVDAVLASLGTARVAVIHGGLAAALRRDAVDAFNAGRLDAIVATDAAGEGLNLHHRCRLVIDLELPWNPLRLEQRIGRVDRIGQSRRVHAIRLVHPGTIEQRVMARLRLRQRRAESALGDGFASESAIANAVFDAADLPEARPPAITSHHVNTAAAEAWRLAQQRGASRLAAPVDGVAWTARRRERGRELIVLQRISLHTESGAVVDAKVAVCQVTLAHPPLNRREWRRAIERLRDDPRLRESLERNALALALADDLERSRAPWLARIARIRAQLRRQARVAHQPSLFDRRADEAAALQRAAMARIDAALEQRAAGIAAAASPRRARVTLVAAFP